MEQGETEAKKKDASVLSGREEVIDKGLFGEGISTGPGPEDMTKAYTGQLTGHLVVELKAQLMPYYEKKGESIFDENKQGRKSAKMALLDEDNSGDLFIPSGVRTGKPTGDGDLFETEEDNSDLLEQVIL